jgi:hypothetical protein
MAYANSWKLGNGSKFTWNSTVYEDCEEISIPGIETSDKVDITSLGASRKEYAVSAIVDSPEIKIVLPFSGTYLTPSDTEVAGSVYVGGIAKTISFSGKIISHIPQAVGVNGKIKAEITIQVTTALTVA